MPVLEESLFVVITLKIGNAKIMIWNKIQL